MSEILTKINTKNSLAQEIAAHEATISVIDHAPIEGARSHFRSRGFNSYISCNPLIAAANVLFSLNLQLQEGLPLTTLDQLHDNLIHEIHSFESNAQDRGYSTETILIARYILCAILDETITFSAANQTHAWQEYKLISSFQNEQTADERFFLIIDRLLLSSTTHIDLLELIYTGLSLGFKGKYRYDSEGFLKLAEIRDSLYQHIRTVRQDPPTLFITTDNTAVTAEPKKNSFGLVILTTVISCLTVIGILFFCYAMIFHEISGPIQQQINSLLNTTQSSV